MPADSLFRRRIASNRSCKRRKQSGKQRIEEGPGSASYSDDCFGRKIKGAEMEKHPFKMPFAPVTNYLTIAFLMMLLIGMWLNDETRMSLIAGIIFLAIVVISFYAFGIGNRVPLDSQKNDGETNG